MLRAGHLSFSLDTETTNDQLQYVAFLRSVWSALSPDTAGKLEKGASRLLAPEERDVYRTGGRIIPSSVGTECAYIPLLRSLGTIVRAFYKHSAPLALPNQGICQQYQASPLCFLI